MYLRIFITALLSNLGSEVWLTMYNSKLNNILEASLNEQIRVMCMHAR